MKKSEKLITNHPEDFKLLKWKVTAEMKKIINEGLKCIIPELPKNVAKDCVINSLDFVKLIKDKDLTEHLAIWAHNKKGVHFHEIKQLLHDLYRDNELKKKYETHIVKFTTIQNIIKYFTQLIGANYCTLIGIHAKTLGHAVIFYVSSDNVLYVIDQQQEILAPVSEYLKKYIDDYQSFIYITVKTTKKHLLDIGTNLKHINIRKKHSSQNQQNKKKKTVKSPQSKTNKVSVLFHPGIITKKRIKKTKKTKRTNGTKNGI
jgi:hypothetical protein